MTNVGEARRLVALARELGVRDFCVCAGSRNAPLIVALGVGPASAGQRVGPASAGQPDGLLKPALHTFFDERAAAFFAVGRMKRDGVPVAVVTTSGTAVAELLPATIESYYAGLPLILITADRPARFRGTGAPQAIDQRGLFGVHAATDLASWNRAMPLHINVEFEEPLIDE